ncbi:MAG: carboxypeptidase-like regulatory domain-containing protein [Flavobacteriales bacterium]|nr:carboxypeptidase-like regulatory domain-containing protein [Flavobacteriales bacterium]
MKKLISLIILFSALSGFSQSIWGSIQGVILDSETGEPVPFANVVVLQNGIRILGTTTDFNGKYTLKSLESGFYNVQIAYVGFQTKRVS